MIQLDFSSDFLEKDIKKLSVIADADSFVYGLFDNQGTMVQRASLPWDRLTSFSQYWTGKDARVYYMSTSKAFSFSAMENRPTLNADYLLYDLWQAQNAYCLYEDKNSIDSNWEYKHVATAWAHFNHSTSDPAIWLHFKEKSITIACGTSHDFRLFNEYQIETAEDAIYYLFATCQQALGLNIEQVTVWISGQITVNSSFYQLLYRFIPKLHTLSSDKFTTKSEILGDHVYFDHYLNISSHANH